ncbi:MAG: transporter substrate-binding domain-containing protein [Shimia sp.]|uniref:transporter substrate-binding domain-containing protein n=1 Tax=Shimia sp. TaxID=1954381 RepID=UPI00405888C7
MKAVTIALVAGLAITQTAFAQEASRVGLSGTYFPFSIVRPDKLRGLEIVVSETLGEVTSMAVEFETVSFSGLIGALEAGRI